MTNREIIEALKKQDRKVERKFYLEHKKTCTQYALKKFFWKRPNGTILKCTEEDAEELYNDACVLFIQNVLRHRIEQLEVKMTTYLINTMKYSWFNKARSIKPSPEQTKIETSESVQESRRIQVRKAIQQLDIKCRAMMTYRYILGWEDYDDIAKATGKNNGAVVRNLISRCRKRFREHYLELTKISGI